MKNRRSAPKNIDEYIASFSPEIQTILEKIRLTIREAAPEAKEKISYQMPTFALMGNLVYFAAFQKHIGLYPPVKGDEKLKAATAPYQGEKGNLKFPVDQPIPYNLIRRIVKFRSKWTRIKPAPQVGCSRRNLRAACSMSEDDASTTGGR
jgi:uncharacterized protein YdhG (YjbR/CyaY superfamily)